MMGTGPATFNRMD